MAAATQPAANEAKKPDAPLLAAVARSGLSDIRISAILNAGHPIAAIEHA